MEGHFGFFLMYYKIISMDRIDTIYRSQVGYNLLFTSKIPINYIFFQKVIYFFQKFKILMSIK